MTTNELKPGTPLPWEMDTIQSEGEYGVGPDTVAGFAVSAIYDAQGKVLFDALNSDVIEVHEDYADEDGFCSAWDATSAANAAYIVHACNAYPALTAERDRLAGEVADRFYIDCEFDGHNGPMLSIALVCGDGRSIHIRTTETASDAWVQTNVIPLMDSHEARLSQWIPLNEVGPSIRHFIGDCARPIIIADSPVDIGRFCQALSTGPDGGWASADYPGIRFEVHNVDCYPTDLPGAVQHNAWWDAMALRRALTQGAA